MQATTMKTPTRNRRGAKRTPLSIRQRGVTLIEILVTLLVLAIGLLGLAALQGISLQTGQVSMNRTQATNLAYEVIDHARANRSQIALNGSLPNQTFFEGEVARLLPNGVLDVDIDAPADDGIITVTITWDDDRTAENAADREGEFVFASRF